MPGDCERKDILMVGNSSSYLDRGDLCVTVRGRKTGTGCVVQHLPLDITAKILQEHNGFWFNDNKVYGVAQKMAARLRPVQPVR